jgi:hypothetical protein
MANKFFRGDAVEVAQVMTTQITGYDAATTYKETLNGKVVSVLGDTNANTTAADLKAALAASTIAEFAEITYSVSTDTVTLTATVAGVPFTAVSSVSGGSGTTSDTAVTTSSGPNDWNVAANWSASGVPGSDSVYLSDTTTDILYGLDQNAVTLTSLNLHSTFTGDLGLPDINVTSGYYEYRQKELLVGITTLNVGEGGGGGSGRIRINGQAIQTTLNVYATGASKEAGVPALRWRGTHASNVVTVRSGDVGIAWDNTFSATVATLNLGSESNPSSDAVVWCGAGCTLTTINQNGGVLTVNGAVGGTWTITKGDAYVRLSGTLTAVKMQFGAGTLFHDSSGTITALTIGKDCVFDASRSKVAFTITNCTMYGGAKLLDPNKRITFSNPITLTECGFEDVTIQRGKNITPTI